MTDYQIELTTRDGQQVCFSASDDQDVISAGEAAGVLLPSLCRTGGCGVCLAHCHSGEYRMDGYSEAVLNADSKSQGGVLLCCTVPTSDLTLTAPYDYSSIGFGGHKKRNAVVTSLESIAERTMKLTLTWQDGSDNNAVEFEPGQFVELEIPDTGVKRAYSLANTPNWRGEMVFLIRLQLGGMFSGYLTDKAAPGEVLEVHEAAGAFTLQAGSLTPAIFIAGGTGLAPFMSMLGRLAEWGEDRPIHLLFGVNEEKEIFYLEQLKALQQQLPSFSFEVCVWKPVDGWTGFSGTPADALEQYLSANGNNFEIYLCGPPKLVQFATAIAHQHGIGEEQVFAENFV